MAMAAPRKRASKKAELAAQGEGAPAVVAIKGFDPDLKCRGFQYEIGGRYGHAGPVVRCAAGGFHSVEGNPLDAFTYYAPGKSRFAEVLASGALARDEHGDSKIASAVIVIKAELGLSEVIKRAAAWVAAAADTALAGKPDQHAAATGPLGHAAATGPRGHAAATGPRGNAAAKGKSAIAASLGIHGTATAGQGGAIVLAYYDTGVTPCRLVRVGAFMVGEAGVEAGRTYRLGANGAPELVA